jgi:phytoene desaturase
MRHVIVIGSGFAGLSAACNLAKSGYRVTVVEKNSGPGGRARKFHAEGFLFDMGPSWYWMPEVFESFFNRFGKKVSDYYDLKRLDPSYRVVYGKNDILDIPASVPELGKKLEALEPGSSVKLKKFLDEAQYKYEVGINELVYKPGLSLGEFADWKLLTGALKLDVFNDMSSHVRKFFKHPKIVQLMEFPVLFLGEKPENTPALYSLMNYADIALGTWYPDGGMHKIVEGMVQLAKELGVSIQYNQNVERIEVADNLVKGVVVDGTLLKADIVVAGADYHHVEQHLLPKAYRRYDEEYWDKRKMAPSSLLFYLGINKRVPNLLHHNLFFDESFKEHAKEIYDHPRWPEKPLFYASAPSKSDPAVAPEGCENLFLLIPVAPGLEDNEEIREKYYHLLMDRLEAHTGENIRDHVIYKRSYAHADFIGDYNAYKGNAYGLANTLMQTAILKPSLKNKKLSNLYYTGQLTVPGPGVPPSLISGIVVTDVVKKEHPLKSHEAVI